MSIDQTTPTVTAAAVKDALLNAGHRPTLPGVRDATGAAAPTWAAAVADAAVLAWLADRTEEAPDPSAAVTDPSAAVLAALPLDSDRAGPAGVTFDRIRSMSHPDAAALLCSAGVGLGWITGKKPDDATTGAAVGPARSAVAAVLERARLAVPVRHGPAPSADALPVTRSAGAPGHVMPGDAPVVIVRRETIGAARVLGYDLRPTIEIRDASDKVRLVPADTVAYVVRKPARKPGDADRAVVVYGWPLVDVVAAATALRVKRTAAARPVPGLEDLIGKEGLRGAATSWAGTLTTTAASDAVASDPKVAAAVALARQWITGERAHAGDKVQVQSRANVRRHDGKVDRFTAAGRAVATAAGVSGATTTIRRPADGAPGGDGETA